MAETGAQTFNFELVSPERKLMSEPARMVVIPGEEGDIGVLPAHSALISSIRPGVIEFFSADGGEKRRIFVTGGFADITGTSCTVLAEEAVAVKDLNRADLEQTIRNLQEDMGMAANDLDKERIARKLAMTKSKLEAVTGHAVH
jgi:F-type H+-transporting ATPase subunit epsilon